MKRSVIIFSVLLLITLGIPAIAVFVGNSNTAGNSNELATIFRASISCLLNFHLFY